MNEKKFAEEFGKINSSFIDEALDYKPENKRGGIYMSKKKILIIAAVIAAIVVTFTAAGIGSRYLLHDYFGSIKDGTAVDGSKGAKIIAVPVNDNSIKFVIEANTKVAPYDEYTELMITSFNFWDGDTPLGGSSANMIDSSPEWFDIYSGDFSLTHPDVSFSCKTVNRDCYVTYVNKSSKKHTYTFVVYALTGRNADGELIEIQGEWTVDFKI